MARDRHDRQPRGRVGALALGVGLAVRTALLAVMSATSGRDPGHGIAPETTRPRRPEDHRP